MTRDDALRALAADFAAGRLTEDDYAVRDAALRAGPVRLRFWPTRVRPKVRDRSRARLLAYSGVMPPALAARWTPCQLAVLRIVSDTSPCMMSIAEIAARAGVSTRTVQSTLRLAAADRLLEIRERPVRAGRNDTNVVRIVSPEWQQWLARGRKGGGCKPKRPMTTGSYSVGAVNCGTGQGLPGAELASTSVRAEIRTSRAGGVALRFGAREVEIRK